MAQEQEDIVCFEVSGTHFREQRSLMLKHPKSKLAEVLRGKVNQDGIPFLGRSVQGFAMMLDFLKSDG